VGPYRDGNPKHDTTFQMEMKNAGLKQSNVAMLEDAFHQCDCIDSTLQDM
jgi:hypothetical protein